MAAAAIVVVVVPVRLHQKQSKIPARIIKTILTKKTQFLHQTVRKTALRKKKTHNTQARITSNLHARIFLKRNQTAQT
jgi:DNA recombination-dependent growth factor C